MPDAPIHGSRLGKLITQLGDDKLLLTRFTGAEAMSELFEFRVDALSIDPDVDFNPVIGTNSTLEFMTHSGEMRYFDGVCTEAVTTGVDESMYSYSLVLRPWLFLLSKRINTMIFAEKTVVDIVTEIFGKYGSLAAHELRLTKNYPKLEYTVQYRESDLDFVRRMLAHYGISFYFKHQKGSHTLVLADGPSSYDAVPGGSRIFRSVEDQIRSEEEHFHHWVPERRFTSGKITTLDYNHKKPTADMKAEKAGDAQYDHGELEIFDYPTKNLDKGEATDFAKVRLDMVRSEDNHHMAAGNCLSLSPGMTVTLEEHPLDRLNTEYLTLTASHSYTSESYTSGHGDAESAAYEGGFEFVTADTAIAPPETVKAPSVQGPQTAVVVGSGEIDCDDEGRILVCFHWDREKTHSMRCRVSQIWAGKGWGGIVLPRVGMEVIVEFIEGDPDRPLVTGCVYNGDNKAPFDLPGKKNISGIKSRSTEGGGGYNEFVFDDTKGNELFRQHAQYDMETKVLNDERREVDVNQTMTIGNNRSATVKAHDTLDVTKTLTVTAGEKITLKCGSSKITMDTSSITIESINVTVKASADLKTSGTMVEHKAGGVMTIKGGMVKIN